MQMKYQDNHINIIIIQLGISEYESNKTKPICIYFIIELEKHKAGLTKFISMRVLDYVLFPNFLHQKS